MSAPAPCLYDAHTVHMRFAPFQRRFGYRVQQIWLDIDQVGDTAAGLKLLSYNRSGPVSFHDRDHGDRTGAPLRPWAERTFAAAGIMLDGGAIRLLCFPRIFGYVFNPLSLYFGYGPDGRARGVIYEVNNTFGDTHSYVAALDGSGPHRHSAEKLLHVSPFLDVAGRYGFVVAPPSERFSLVVENWRDGAREHLATLKGRRRPLTDAALLRLLIGLPLMTLQVIAGIHFQALLIWLKGGRYRSRPNPPPPASIAHAPPASRGRHGALS